MPIINKEIDRKKNEVTWAEGVVQFVKLDKYPEVQVFVYQGKKIESTHKASILIKEKGKEGRDDEGVWIGLGDIKLHPDHEELQIKDGDNWVTIERGVEVSVDIKKVSTGKNGVTYYNSSKGNITVISTEGVQKSSDKSSTPAKGQEKKAYTPRDTTGMEVGHAVNGGFELVRSGASLSPVEAAKVVHNATVTLKAEEAKKRGVEPTNYDVGASVGHAILNACKNSGADGVSIKSEGDLIVEAKKVLDVSEEITSYVKGGETKASPQKEENKQEVKKPAKEVHTPPMDFDDSDLPF